MRKLLSRQWDSGLRAPSKSQGSVSWLLITGIVVVSGVVAAYLALASGCESDEPTGEEPGSEAAISDKSRPEITVPEDVTLAWSTSSDTLPEGSVTIVISQTAVLVEGEPVVPVVDNDIAESDRVSASSPIVPDLQSAIEVVLHEERRWATYGAERGATSEQASSAVADNNAPTSEQASSVVADDDTPTSEQASSAVADNDASTFEQAGSAAADDDAPTTQPIARFTLPPDFFKEMRRADERRAVSEAKFGQRVATLVVDRAISYQVLTYVMMTASAAGVQQFVFATSSCDESGVAALRVHSPRNRRIRTVTDEMREVVESTPLVLVAITEAGFTISDLRHTRAFEESGNGRPVAGCPQETEVPLSVPVTICASDSPSGDLLERLSFRELYNRLTQIRSHADWTANWSDCHPALLIVADRDVPFEVVIRTADVARVRLERDSYADDAEFEAATFRIEDGQPVGLFPMTILLLPRAPTNGSTTSPLDEAIPEGTGSAPVIGARSVRRPPPSFCGQSVPAEADRIPSRPMCPQWNHLDLEIEEPLGLTARGDDSSVPSDEGPDGSDVLDAFLREGLVFEEPDCSRIPFGGGPEGRRRTREMMAECEGFRSLLAEVELGNPTVEGDLDGETIRRSARRHRHEIRDCYQRELERTVGLGGRVDVWFLIDPAGNVPLARIESSELANENVEECLVRRLRRWRFPAPGTPGNVRVLFPFTLTTPE